MYPPFGVHVKRLIYSLYITCMSSLYNLFKNLRYSASQVLECHIIPSKFCSHRLNLRWVHTIKVSVITCRHSRKF